MSDYEQAVFISYAWGEETHERETIVNQLDQALQKRGLKIIRDKRDLGYKGMIRQFMERIGEGSCVIVVISDKYLRSKNCMYELVEIAENKDFANRIFPIVLSDAKIYDGTDRIQYISHWEKKEEELEAQMRGLKNLSNLQGVNEEINDYHRFRNEIDDLTTRLKNMNSLSPDILRESDFQQLYDALVERMGTTLVKNKTAHGDKKSNSNIQKENKTMGNDEGKVSANNNSNAVGNISIGGGITGNFVIGNNNTVSNTINNGLSATDIKQLFDSVNTKIDALPQLDQAIKADAKEEVKDIQENITEAVTNKGNLDESFLTRRFRSIARMAPDILDVIVATIVNPLGGVGVAVKKIADKAKEEAKG